MLRLLVALRMKIRAVRGRLHNRRIEMKRRPWRVDPRIKQNIIDQFHRLYYDGYGKGLTWGNTFWRGVKTEKCPLDLWVYQEIIQDLKPDLIIETGTRFGGSALFMADVCTLVGNGRIVTIDIDAPEGRPQDDKITYVSGSSVAGDIVTKVKGMIEADTKVMVVLDSDHSKAHVFKELQAYAPLVSKGQYLIVEDTNVNGHPVADDFGPGPMEAVDEFLSSNSEFSVDDSREKFYLTFSPRGYLRKA